MLDLSVAPHAVPPVRKRLRWKWDDIFASEAIDITEILVAANAPTFRSQRARRRVESPQGATAASAELIALGRMQATARTLESRFGLDSALAAVTSANVGNKLGVAGVIEDIDVFVPFEVLPPLPAVPTETQTSIELPWRLQISPNASGAFAHSATAVEHNGRFELWHTRLGVRALGPDGKRVLDDEGKPTVDEHSPDLRTIRAVWARDFAQLPQFGFSSPPAAFPKADGTQDKPLVRTSLNSRDRMMLVHETSNFHLERTATQGNPARWTPEAVPTNRLMLTALGGWLDSRVLFETLPDGGLTIEEWKHRAALGRDHEVKVVYAGFLMPFGHRASLVKITERKFAAGPAGPVAYMFQRMFIIVREPVRQYPEGAATFVDKNGETVNVGLSNPLGMVQILTTVTPPLDPPQSLPAVSSGMFFMPRVGAANFPFKIVATDVENNVLEFEAPLVFVERDHNVVDGKLEAARDTYNAHALVDREFDLKGQKVAYADSVKPDDTMLSTSSLTFNVAIPIGIGGSQDEPRFVPVLDEAQVVVPAMSALTGDAAPQRVKYQKHYAKQGFASNAVEAFLEFPTPPGMKFAGKGDRSGGFVTPSLNVKALVARSRVRSRATSARP